MIKLMKKASDPIGNPTRELPACNTVPQTTAPSRTQFGAVWYPHTEQFIRNPSRLKKHSTIWEVSCFFVKFRKYGSAFIVLCSYAYVFERVLAIAKRHYEVWYYAWTLFSLVESSDVSDIPAASINKNDDYEWDFYEQKAPNLSAKSQNTAIFVHSFDYISLSAMEAFLPTLL